MFMALGGVRGLFRYAKPLIDHRTNDAFLFSGGKARLWREYCNAASREL
jgi:hypothetical protein